MSTSSDLVAHMRGVQAAERHLHDLGLWWQMIESSAAISCPDAVGHILPTLVRTRERFDELQRRLVERMAGEHHAALGDDLRAKAQCAIDILVRNLFERTADVGFLATDEQVHAFCAMDAGARDAQQATMTARLREYRAKYTVYDDIVLLSPQGDVLARLDDQAPLARSTDPVIAAALASNSYVERYAHSDLAAGGRPALLYAHRIGGQGTAPVGVLVLRFRFEDEMARIFAGVADDRHEMAVMLIDDSHHVAASNDEAHVPVGAKLRALVPGEVTLTAFGGREYMAVVCATHGYQGYNGPGWRAQAMVSLLTAFRGTGAAQDAADAHVPLDNADLTAICQDAEAINRDLRRAVWNGRLDQQEHHADAQRMKAVLTQVNHAGHRTRERVDLAIRELYGTSIARIRRQTVDLARLAANVMDRNLYERANDCRWWALSPALRAALAQPPSTAGSAAINATLDHINGLYTVYSRLVVFDAEGCIRGASRVNDQTDLLGRAVDAGWLAAVRGLGSAQHYAVTDYAACALHDGGDTYVYLASLRDESSDARCAGGIAAIFNSRHEFETMLRELLGDRPGMAAFVDANGRVLASTDPALAHADFRSVATSPTDATLVTHAGMHYACARVRATGYREFKVNDGYDNQVSAIVALRLGAEERRRTSLAEQRLEAPAAHKGGAGKELIDLAVCQVGPGRYALPADALVEALPQTGLVRTPAAHTLSVGLLEVGGHQLVPVLCARRLMGLTYPPRASDGVVLVLRNAQTGAPVLGLRVDDVITVLSVPSAALHAPPDGLPADAYIAGLVDCGIAGTAGTAMVQLLSTASLRALLPTSGAQTVAQAVQQALAKAALAV